MEYIQYPSSPISGGRAVPPEDQPPDDDRDRPELQDYTEENVEFIPVPFPDRMLLPREVSRLNTILDRFGSDLSVRDDMTLYDVLDSWETLTYGSEDVDDLLDRYESYTGEPLRVLRGGVSCPLFSC